MSYPQSHNNLAYATVATPPSPATSGTSLTVANGLGSLFPASNFSITVYPPNVEPLASNAEICLCTSRTGDVLTITRAQEGTSAKSIATGWQVANTLTALQLTEMQNAISGGGGSAVWGGITGTLSAQTDLQSALNAKLTAASNLSDVANAATARTNLGLAIGTNVQAQDASLQDLANASLVQGDVLYQNATNLVRLPAGTNGHFLQTQGAGANPQWAASSAAGALLAANNLSDVANTSTSRTNLGVAIGTNVQAQSALLQDIASETFAQGDILYYNGSNLVNLGPGTSGQFLKTQGAGANPIWDTAPGAGPTIVTKSSDQTVTNSVTFTNDSELLFALAANTFYHVEFYIKYSGNSDPGDYHGKFIFPALTFASNATGTWRAFNTSFAFATNTFIGNSTTEWPSGFMPLAIDTSNNPLLLIGTIDILTAGASGNLQYQFANFASGVGRSSTTRAGSVLKIFTLS